MVTKQQRERQLARAKWERQRARRSAHAARIHKLVIAGWAAFGLAVAGLIVWFGATQLGGSSPAPAQAPVLPEVSQPTVFQPPNYSPPPTPSSAPSTPAGSATDRGQR